MLPASPICQVSVPPSLLPFLAWKLLLNYVHFTIFVSQWRVRPQTPLTAVTETTRPNVRSITSGARPPHRETQQSTFVKNRARAINRFRFRRPRAPPAARAPDHRSLPSAKPRELFRELDPIVGAHPPLHPAAAPSTFFCGGRSSDIFLSPLFCRSLFMLHLLMHLTQQSTLLQLGIEQIRALTTMFTVEDSSDNEFGDNHNGWENNKQ